MCFVLLLSEEGLRKRMIFESHAHYDDEKFNEDREMLINSLPENEIEYLCTIIKNCRVVLN